jgi:hypothetical protein
VRNRHEGGLIAASDGGGMAVKGAGHRIREAVLGWPGVDAHPHRFGGEEYRVGNREIGHLHGDWLADLPFPTRVREALVAAGRAEPHHILPDSGWVSFYLREAGDVEKAIGLFRESYELALKQKSRGQARAAEGRETQKCE